MLPISDFKHKTESKKFPVGQIKLRVVVSLGLLAFLLFASQLVFANNLAEDGQKLSQLERETQQLEAQNTTLKTDIAKESSFTTLQEKAQKMGFKAASLASK